MKYTVNFTQNGIEKRTVIEADSEFYARRMLLQRASGEVTIESCTVEDPFQGAKDIMDFLNGFGKH